MTMHSTLWYFVAFTSTFAARARTLPPFDLPWDPEPLPRGWTNQFRDVSLSKAPNCSAAKIALVCDSQYGRINNALIEFARILEIAASRPDANLTVVVVPDIIKEYFPPDLFDYQPLSSWVCVALDGPPPGVPVLHDTMAQIFHWKSDSVFGALQERAKLPWVDFHWFDGKVFSQILLRARNPIRARVDGIINAHGRHYIAIHLRQLEGTCEKRAANVANEPPLRTPVRITAQDLGREVTPADVCLVSDAYLAAALAKDRVPRDWPILILHDGQEASVARVPQLIRRFGAVDVNATEPLVAMLLLAKSSYLVGNPASTFSLDMADIRRASGAAAESTTLNQNRQRCDS